MGNGSTVLAVGTIASFVGCGGAEKSKSKPDSVAICISGMGEWLGSIRGARGFRSLARRDKETYALRQVPHIVSPNLQR